ncbi:hypothetical protein ACHHYP_15288 [Achlya hypogyna]|uniref:Uncharacterized protein n=1 Tax=Achlya hypogyna TaxID=1202772 RepID=A0A1V9YB77_ACHHY|nr:hypothetical protein ACHHYP_15288 [Achlya hypogyna]
MMDHEAAVDVFSLHNRKKRDVDVEMLDYDYVEKCTDVELLKNILAVLQSGKEGKYPQLERATEAQLLKVLPQSERDRIERLRSQPSYSDIDGEKQALASWERDMEAKLRRFEEEAQHKSAVPRQRPAVRGRPQTSPAAPLVQEVMATTTATKKKQAIPAYDWRAWEKYDVEKAEAELDMEEVRKAEESRKQREELAAHAKRRQAEANMPISVDVENLTPTEREVYALHEKHKGNECFKLGENDEAILYYSRSLAYDPTNAIVHANRALTHLRLQNFAKAEDDCSRAIELDSSYVKAWSRRGMTRFRRGKYSEAVADFTQALVLDPENREIEKLLKKTEEKWLEVDGTRGGTLAPPPLEPPFRRFEIVEDDEEEVPLKSGLSRADAAPSQPFQRFEIIQEDDDDDDDDDEEVPVLKDAPRFEILQD